ncbi:MAG: molecular chaperone DnaK [Myxococcales bacterium]|nr:molecular chaperone DnaK [Myxococcales bacterium]MCB9520507.1 molecular chaperone DnaK [Myxococcales bacterium]
MGKIIGIDLGTSNSCVAVLEGGQPLVLPNAEGARTTPSIVAFAANGERLVGQQAKRQAIVNPDRTVSGAKRLIGRRFRSDEVRRLAERLPYRVVENLNGDVWVEVGGDAYSPQEVSASVLSKMKATAEDYFGEEITEAVITVPAYFDDAQRQATKDAGRIAGLDVRRIINEPTAAALAYGMRQRERAYLAVFDLGGGTFDISIVRVENEVFEVLATAGDNALGGDDFDRVVLDRLLEAFHEQHGLDLSGEPVALQRLREAAETAKCELSTLAETNINLPFLAVDATGPKHLNYLLTRSELNDLVAPLVSRLEEPCTAALADAGLDVADLNEVLLVGGMTRMPLVQERVQDIFKRAPRKGVNPDEVVACGAAVQSGILGGELREVVLMDVTPLSLGIRVYGDRMSTVIPKNTPIPTKKTRVFTTTEDNQDVVTINVVQGENPQASRNRSLGRFHLSGIPPAAANLPRIEVEFSIDTDGIVHVTAAELETRRSNSIAITDHGGLTDEDIKRATTRTDHRVLD